MAWVKIRLGSQSTTVQTKIAQKKMGQIHKINAGKSLIWNFFFLK